MNTQCIVRFCSVHPWCDTTSVPWSPAPTSQDGLQVPAPSQLSLTLCRPPAQTTAVPPQPSHAPGEALLRVLHTHTHTHTRRAHTLTAAPAEKEERHVRHTAGPRRGLQAGLRGAQMLMLIFFPARVCEIPPPQKK